MLALLLTVAGADTGTMEIAAAMASAGMTDGSNLADLTCVEQSWPPPQISGLYAFSGAEAGSSIEDGGNDMYDGGNMMWLRVNGQWSPHALKYTQVCFGGDMGEGAGRGDAEYNTCYLSSTAPLFAAVFTSPTASIDGFRVDGNLGADGKGFQAASTTPLQLGNRTEHVFGFFKSVYGAGDGSAAQARADPSINHLIIAPASGTSSVGLTTDSDRHEVILEHGVGVLYYLLWGGTKGKQYVQSDFQAVLDKVGTRCIVGRSIPVASAPPPPPFDSAGCASRPCGPEATCLDFVNTLCDIPNGLKAKGVAGCECQGCCKVNPSELMPPPPSPPPPSPHRPAPAPAACHVSCAGTTCGALQDSCLAIETNFGCDCSGCCTGSTDLQCVTSKWPPQPLGLPNLFAFTDGLTGRAIPDGGSDMFDYANYLSINLGPTYETGKWQYRLPYNQDCSGLFPTKLDVGDGVYSTCKLTDGEPIADVNGYGYSRQNGDVTTGTLFSASFFSKSKHITGFFVYGNLGADGGGASLAMNLTGPLGTYGYYKQVYGAGSDPSINHLVITRAPPSKLTWAGLAYNTNSDYQSVHFSEGQELLIYLLWAGKEANGRSFQYGRKEAQRILDSVASSCFTILPPSLYPEPSPPPRPADTSMEDCKIPCGRDYAGQTCADFVTMACDTLSSGNLPFTCGCGNCCDPNPTPKPPPPYIKPPAAPPPLRPTDGSCSKSCAGTTCGALQPMTCSDMVSVLGCDCGGCCDTPLDARCVESVWPVNLPSLYRFSQGILGYYIGDGGRDMYDVGNEVSVRINGKWSGPMYYNQNCDGSNPHPVGGYYKMGDATYITCKLPLGANGDRTNGFGRVWVLIVMSPGKMIDGISVLGNLGADEGGKQEANGCSAEDCNGGPLYAQKNVFGYYKKTFGADAPGVSLADPSVNHLIFGQGIDNAEVKIGSTTDSDLHELKFKEGVELVYYVMWAGNEGYEYPRSDFQETLESLVESCFVADYTPAGHGMGAGTIVLIIILVLGGIACLGGCFVYRKKLDLDSVKGMMGKVGGRSRTSPGSTVSLGNPPLTSPMRAQDSAAENFNTAYTPPINSSTL